MEEKLIYAIRIVGLVFITSVLVRCCLHYFMKEIAFVSFTDWLFCCIPPIIILYSTKKVRPIHFVVIPIVFTALFVVSYHGFIARW